MIAAAGSGERLGAGGPKAFIEVAGRPLLDWSIEAFQQAESVEEVVVAAPPGREDEVGPDGVIVVAGGEHRSESVARALERCGAELVVVHDAARPLVAPELIDAVVEELAAHQDAAGVIAAAPVSDTIKQADDDRVVERTLDRAGLWAVQTPQAFRVAALRDALSDTALLAGATDDAMLVERHGGRVLIHSAPSENLKVTTPFDLRVAELLLAERG